MTHADDEILAVLSEEEMELFRGRESFEREAVARRAYEIFLSRGGAHGRDVEDWLRAEAELRGWK